MIKVVCISDTHGQIVKNLPDADILIHSGDWSSRGTWKETNDFLIWMGQIRMGYKKVVCVPGNHDRWIDENTPLAKDEFAKLGIDLLIDQTMYYGNHVIHGNPWSPEFGSWSFMANDVEREGYCRLIPADTTILVSHAPPEGYLDTLAWGSSEPGKHAGCQWLKEAVLRIKPKLHTFGHIHEGSGIQGVDGTLLVNASCMDEDYRLVNGYKVVYV